MFQSEMRRSINAVRNTVLLSHFERLFENYLWVLKFYGQGRVEYEGDPRQVGGSRRS